MNWLTLQLPQSIHWLGSSFSVVKATFVTIFYNKKRHFASKSHAAKKSSRTWRYDFDQ